MRKPNLTLAQVAEVLAIPHPVGPESPCPGCPTLIRLAWELTAIAARALQASEFVFRDLPAEAPAGSRRPSTSADDCPA